MQGLLERLGIEGLFARLPGPLLAMSVLMVTGFLCLDLILPDPILLLDEAVLFLLFVGGNTELLRRIRGKRGTTSRTAYSAGASSSADEVRKAPSELKTLGTRAAAANDLARGIAGRGGSPKIWDRTRDLAVAAKAMAAELRDHDGFLARRDNDPWQVDRRITKLEQEVAAMEADGALRPLDVGRKALEVARAQRARITHRVMSRDALILDMQSLSAQVDLLTEDLRALAAGRLVQEWAVTRISPLDPRVQAVVEAFQEARVAEEEVDDAVRRGARPRVTL